MILTGEKRSIWRRTSPSATLLSVLFAIIVINANTTTINGSFVLEIRVRVNTLSTYCWDFDVKECGI